MCFFSHSSWATALAGTSATGMDAKAIINFHDLVLNKIKGETQYGSQASPEKQNQ